jgi:GNAT superfamily N-acetyltransferase
MFTIRDANTNDVATIRSIAETTWWPTYSPILEKDQIEYMLEKIYNAGSLSELISHQLETFILLMDERGCQGFASYGIKNKEASIYKLKKIYVLPENHGKGYGKILVNEIVNRMLSLGVKTLDLNVNRYNSAKNFYEKLGFKVIGEEDVPIGPYLMNDFVLRLEIEKLVIENR